MGGADFLENILALYFFPGLHQPSNARHFERCCISIVRLRGRVSDFEVHDWLLDSGAFSEIKNFGEYRHGVAEYASEVRRWSQCGNLLAAVGQDYMCEPDMLGRTGLSIADHQRLTIERYDELLRCETGVYIMPVLQGYAPEDYARHLWMYGDRLATGAWVGVGSVCKRNGDPRAIEDVLLTIYHARPDLRLHGFGIKFTALRSGIVQEVLHSSDSMAWSFQARMEGRNGNDWREAKRWETRIRTMPVQVPLFLPTAASSP